MDIPAPYINSYVHEFSLCPCISRHSLLLGILCGSCVNNAGVGVLSQTCLENCHSYAGAISIILLGNHISSQLFRNLFVIYICSTLEWNFSNIIFVFIA